MALADMMRSASLALSVSKEKKPTRYRSAIFMAMPSARHVFPALGYPPMTQ